MREDPYVERRQTFNAIGDVGFNIVAEAIGQKALVNNTGRGSLALDFGENAFRQRMASLGFSVAQMEQATEELKRSYAMGQQLCESPIERDVLAALLTGRWQERFVSVPPKVHAAKSQDELPKGDLVIVPQMAFVRFRVDFMLVAIAGAERQMVAVECDGAEYHRDVAKDVARSHYLASWGIPTFRMTGTAIFNEPGDAIAPVVAWLNDWRAARP